MRPSRWATHSASLHGLSDGLPRTLTTNHPSSIKSSLTPNSLTHPFTEPIQTRPGQTAHSQARIQARSHPFVAWHYHPPRLIAHRLCRKYCGTIPSTHGGYRCTHVDSPNTTTHLAANHLPQHPRPGPTPPATSTAQTALNDWLRCRCSPGQAHGTIINTMLKLFHDPGSCAYNLNTLRSSPIILVVCRVVHASRRPPKSRLLASAQHRLPPVTHHPRSRDLIWS